MEVITLFGAAAVLSITFILLFRPLAQRIGLVDQPGGRKDHSQPTPLVGGIAVFCAFSLTVLTLDTPLGQWRSFFLAALLVFIMGILDDIRETPPSTRFVAQISASLIIVLGGGVELRNLGALVSSEDLVLGLLAVPFTLFSAAGVINATNMLDGLDGLAGGLLLIFFSVLLYLAWGAGLNGEVSILLLLCGALAGFLIFNFRFVDSRPATVFMGDSGSLFLGLAVTWFLIRFTQEPIALLHPITAVWLFALPILDTVAIMVRRIRRGRSPFSPDREHLHHILLAAGFSVRSTVLIMLGIGMLLGGIGLAGEWTGVAESTMFYGFLLLFAAYYWVMQRAWKVMKTLRRVHESKSGARYQHCGGGDV